MKATWQKFTIKVDALTLRERVLMFAAAAAGIIFLIHYLVLNPLFLKQKGLMATINQQQNNSAGIDAEITAKIMAYAVDPDLVSRGRLQKMEQEIEQMNATLRAMEKGLVAPDKIIPLLENIMKGNGKLRLLSLKTLPSNGMMDGAFDPPKLLDDAKAGTDQLKPGLESKPTVKPDAKPAVATGLSKLLFRHGVEIVMQGGYVDMVNYMAALEAMPTQLFWGKAKLGAEQYPNATLTLTLYTLSLDQKWMKL